MDFHILYGIPYILWNSIDSLELHMIYGIPYIKRNSEYFMEFHVYFMEWKFVKNLIYFISDEMIDMYVLIKRQHMPETFMSFLSIWQPFEMTLMQPVKLEIFTPSCFLHRVWLFLKKVRYSDWLVWRHLLIISLLI